MFPRVFFPFSFFLVPPDFAFPLPTFPKIFWPFPVGGPLFVVFFRPPKPRRFAPPNRAPRPAVFFGPGPGGAVAPGFFSPFFTRPAGFWPPGRGGFPFLGGAGGGPQGVLPGVSPNPGGPRGGTHPTNPVFPRTKKGGGRPLNFGPPILKNPFF